MSNNEIPLSPDNQIFSIDLAGVTYRLTVLWNTPAAVWVLDIADILDNPILQGIPLVTGVDLLSPYPYLNFGGKLIAQTDNVPDVPPTYNDLGITGHLYFVTL
jgi:hypothetical protein